LLNLIFFSGIAQNKYYEKSAIDALQKIIQNASHDSVKINAYLEWDNLIYISDPDKDLELNLIMKEICESNLAKNISGVEKKFFYNKLSTVLNNLGTINQVSGNYPEALEYYNSSLKIYTSLGNKAGMAKSFGNMGVIFNDQGNDEMALLYYKKSLVFAKESGEKSDISNTYLNIGNIFSARKEYQKALDYYFIAMEMDKKSGDKSSLANVLGNIGFVYKMQGDELLEAGDLTKGYSKFNISMEYIEQALEIELATGNKYYLAHSYLQIANIYYSKKEYAKTEEFSRKAYEIAKEINAVIRLRDAALSLYTVNKIKGNYNEALAMYEEYIINRDKIMSEETALKLVQQEYNYKYKQKTEADSLKIAKEKEVSEAKIVAQEAQLERGQAIRWGLFGGSSLLLVFAIVMFNRFRISQKQKQLIEHQKKLVERKNKEVLDSINYAKHLQQAILATPQEISKHLPQNFLLYKPKDIVAGDFYFFETTDTHIFIAAADCTGHGVPGAMVSVVCSNALTRCVKEFEISDPGKILDKTRQLVVSTFEKSGTDVKDGMDISLLVINKNTKEMMWSGANNPLWVVKKVAGLESFESEESSLVYSAHQLSQLSKPSQLSKLIEFKPDKQPIGKTAQPLPFKTQQVKITGGNMIYLFTDGYADQFGGETREARMSGGKKYKYSKLKNLLASISDLSPGEQLEKLENEFWHWKGGLEQLDDVCIIGIRF